MFQLSKDLGYRIYSALGSFYIPSCIMVFVYIRIYFAAKARARRGIRKPPSKPTKQQRKLAKTTAAAAAAAASSSSPTAVSQTTSFITRPTPAVGVAGAPPQGFRSPPATPLSATLPVIACDYASDASTSDVSKDGDKDTLKVFTTQGSRRLTVNGDLGPGGRCRASSVAVDADLVSELEPSSSDSGNVQKCGVVKPVKARLCKPIFGGRKSAAKAAASAKAKRDILDTGRVSCTGGHHAHHNPSSASPSPGGGDGSVELGPVPPPRPKPRDPEREKRRIARKKEKRATLILGLIMGSFIACWLPFFFMYILTPLCPACHVPPQAFTIAFWLGYMNSAINPVIYTIFNKDFRRSFRRVLFK